MLETNSSPITGRLYDALGNPLKCGGVYSDCFLKKPYKYARRNPSKESRGRVPTGWGVERVVVDGVIRAFADSSLLAVKSHRRTRRTEHLIAPSHSSDTPTVERI